MAGTLYNPMKNLAWLGAFSLLLAACAPQQTRPLAETETAASLGLDSSRSQPPVAQLTADLLGKRPDLAAQRGAAPFGGKRENRVLPEHHD